jgi:uncharacterized membrane protein
MAEYEIEVGDETPDEEAFDAAFRPVGSLFLLTVYIFIFATAWGLVYFTDLLARR